MLTPAPTRRDAHRHAVRMLADLAHLFESEDDARARIEHALVLLGTIVPYDCCALLIGTAGQPGELIVQPVAATREREMLAAVLPGHLALLAEAADSSAPTPSTPLEPHWGSHLILPLVSRDRVQGLIFVGRAAPDAYDEDALSVLAVVAAQLGAYLAELDLAQQVTLATGLADAVVQQLPLGVIVVEAPSGRMLFANEHVERIQRLPPRPEGATVDFTRLTGLHADGRPFTPEDWPLARALQHGEVVRGERLRFERPDGSVGTLAAHASPIRDTSGATIAAVVAFEDVTARERAEAALRLLAEASAQLDTSLDLTTTLQRAARLAVPTFADICNVYLVDTAGQINRVEGVCADPTRQAALRAIQARFSPGRSPFVQEVLREGRPRLYPRVTDDLLAARAADAEHLRLLRVMAPRSFIMVPLRVGDRLVGALAFVYSESGRQYSAEDLPLAEALAQRCALALDRARTYTQAQVAEAYYRGLFEGSADAVLVADADGRYLEANTAAEALLGYTQDELRALRIADVAAPGAEWTAEEFARFTATGEWRGELEVRRKDGTRVPVEAWAHTVELPGGAVYLAALRDITARRAFEQLQQEFIAMATHELRTPLTALKGQAQLLQRRGVYDERRVAALVSAARHMERMVGDLLDVAHLEGGRLELRATTADLVPTVLASVEQARALSAAHTIAVEVPATPVRCWYDPDRVAQILHNLLGNAVKYSPEGGRITLRLSVLDDEVQIAVADDGVGIAPEALPHLFERFYRARAATASGAAGLGLGLHITRGLVEAHGGRIWAASTLGQGSTFTFTLPCSPQPSA